MPALCSELLGAVVNWLLNLLQDYLKKLGGGRERAISFRPVPQSILPPPLLAVKASVKIIKKRKKLLIHYKRYYLQHTPLSPCHKCCGYLSDCLLLLPLDLLKLLSVGFLGHLKSKNAIKYCHLHQLQLNSKYTFILSRCLLSFSDSQIVKRQMKFKNYTVRHHNLIPSEIPTKISKYQIV